MKEIHYNATVEYIKLVHDELCIIRVKPDVTCTGYLPGQYITLGLFDNEPRVDAATQPALPPDLHDHKPKLIQRAYSISCTLLDETQELHPCSRYDYLEFYITRVTIPDEYEPHYRPRLTPRLFGLKAGDRLFMTSKPKGVYTMGDIASKDNIIFVATGTGEAPHNAMLGELLKRGHQGNIASLCCVRYRKDSGYIDIHQTLMQRYPQYRYRLYTTREPENLDQKHPAYIGKQYLQNVFQDDSFKHQFGWTPDPANTSVFLCGNPDMIGIPDKDEQGLPLFIGKDNLTGNSKPGMIEILIKQGFKFSFNHGEGKIHYEKYW